MVVVQNKQSMAAIVLAGGVSQRMGKANKLHLEVDGTPILRRCIETLLNANIQQIVVVLGYEYQMTRQLIDDMPVHTVYNADYSSGQMTSVHCGLAAIEHDFSGVMVALGDQPALTVNDINYLIDAYSTRGKAEVVIPTYQGNRGNPIIISEQSRKDILAGKRKLGCRRFIKDNPDLVRMVKMNSPGVITDLDTPQEYRHYCENISKVS